MPSLSRTPSPPQNGWRGSAQVKRWKSGVSAEVIGLPDHSVGDALYRAKITLSTPDVFAWTLVIVLLSAALSAAAAALLRTAKTRLCGEVRV